MSTEPEIRRQSNLDSTTPFVPPNRPPAVTGSSSLLPVQRNQNDNDHVHNIMAPSGPATDVRNTRRNLFSGDLVPCEGIAQKMETKDVLIFVAESHRARGNKLMEETMKTNSTTDALVAASFLSPQPYKGLLCRELKQSDGEGGGIIIVSESCLGHACFLQCYQVL